MSSCLLEKGFRRSKADQGKEGIIVILIYVDDSIITNDNVTRIKQTKDLLKSSFDIKNLGDLKYFLGIEISHFDDGMFISQRKYIHVS